MDNNRDASLSLSMTSNSVYCHLEPACWQALVNEFVLSDMLKSKQMVQPIIILTTFEKPKQKL